MKELYISIGIKQSLYLGYDMHPAAVLRIDIPQTSHVLDRGDHVLSLLVIFVAAL